MQTIIKIFATFFYIGYLPVARGTLSALAALVLYYFVKDSLLCYTLTTLFLILAGFLVSGKAENIFNKKDASEITIDDASGMLVALFLIPQKPVYIITGFLLYRLFDITKIPPLKKIETLKGSAGVMCDDLVAGIYTNLILQALRLILNR